MVPRLQAMQLLQSVQELFGQSSDHVIIGSIYHKEDDGCAKMHFSAVAVSIPSPVVSLMQVSSTLSS